MSAAAYPSLTTTVIVWVVVFTLGSIAYGMVLVCGDWDDPDRPPWWVLVGVWLVGVVALTVALAFIYHAAWIDYERSPSPKAVTEVPK